MTLRRPAGSDHPRADRCGRLRPVLLLLFGRPLATSLIIGVVMLIFYIPAGYYMDLYLWRRRERQRIRAKSKG